MGWPAIDGQPAGVSGKIIEGEGGDDGDDEDEHH